MRLLTKTADAIAGAVADWCSASFEGDWGDTCCRDHDLGPYSTAPRWRIDLKLLADIRLGWCIATRTPSSGSWGRKWWGRVPYHVGHVAVGAVYAVATGLLGWPWWFKRRDPKRAAIGWAKGRVAKAKIRAKVRAYHGGVW